MHKSFSSMYFDNLKAIKTFRLANKADLGHSKSNADHAS